MMLSILTENFDIIINGKGYMLARPEELEDESVFPDRPRNYTARQVNVDAVQEERYGVSVDPESGLVWQEWNDFSQGGGFRHNKIPNTYANADGVDAGTKGIVILMGAFEKTSAGAYAGGVGDVIEATSDGKLLWFNANYALFADGTLDRDLAVELAGIVRVGQCANWDDGTNNLLVVPVFDSNDAETDFLIRASTGGAAGWTVNTATNHARAFAVTGSTKDASQLWRAVNNNQVSSCGGTGKRDPNVAANWSGDYFVGDMGSKINSMVGMDNQLYIGKEDTLYQLTEEGKAIILLPHLAGMQDAMNGWRIWTYGGWVFYPHVSGLWMYRDGVAQCIWPDPDWDDITWRGVVRCGRGIGKWIYILVYDSVDDETTLYKGRPRGLGDLQRANPFIWHQLYQFKSGATGTNIAAAGDFRAIAASDDTTGWSASGTQDFLLCCIENGNLLQVELPKEADNYLMGNNSFHGGTGYITIPYTDFGMPYAQKRLATWQIMYDYKGAAVGPTTNQLSIDYAKDEDTTVGGYDTQTFSSLVAASAITSKWKRAAWTDEWVIRDFQLRVLFKQDTGTEPQTPILRKTRWGVHPRPTRLDRIDAIIKCADNLTDRRGNTITDRSATDMLSDLRALVDNTVDIAITTPDGTSLANSVMVIGDLREIETKQEGHKRPVTYAAISLVRYN